MSKVGETVVKKHNSIYSDSSNDPSFYGESVDVHIPGNYAKEKSPRPEPRPSGRIKRLVSPKSLSSGKSLTGKRSTKWDAMSSARLSGRLASFTSSRSNSVGKRTDSFLQVMRNSSFSSERGSADKSSGLLSFTSERISSFSSGRLSSFSNGRPKFSNSMRLRVSGALQSSVDFQSGGRVPSDGELRSPEPARPQRENVSPSRVLVRRLLSSGAVTSFLDTTTKLNTKKNRGGFCVAEHLIAMDQLASKGQMSANSKYSSAAFAAVIKSLPQKDRRLKFKGHAELITWVSNVHSDLKLLELIARRVRQKSLVHHGKLILNACFGWEIVRCLSESSCTEDEDDARELAAELLNSHRLGHALGKDHRMIADEEPYRIRANVPSCWPVPRYKASQLVALLHKGLPLRDEKRGGRSFSMCFTGSEFIDFVVNNEVVETLEAAKELGTRLMTTRLIDDIASKRFQMDSKKAIYRLLSRTPAG